MGPGRHLPSAIARGHRNATREHRRVDLARLVPPLSPTLKRFAGVCTSSGSRRRATSSCRLRWTRRDDLSERVHESGDGTWASFAVSDCSGAGPAAQPDIEKVRRSLHELWVTEESYLRKITSLLLSPSESTKAAMGPGRHLPSAIARGHRNCDSRAERIEMLGSGCSLRRANRADRPYVRSFATSW
jgi:hypothetical protein